MKTTPPPHSKLYNTVAKRRKEIDFPPSTLADRVGINRSTLFKIEQGQIIPSVYIALKLAQFFETTVEKLFTLEETKVLTEVEEFDLYIQRLLEEERARKAVEQTAHES